jgi:DNA-binding response OmpR family regulator
MTELLARIEARIRRGAPASSPQGAPAVARFADIEADFRKATVTKGGTAVELSAKELQLLRYLHDHAGDVVSRAELLKAVWGYTTTPFTRTVDVHVANLRKKLEDDPASPALIQTVHGLGYRLTVDH